MREKILALRQKGKTYLEISKELQCSKSLVAYYCNDTSKHKSRQRTKKRRKNQHPLQRKIENFIYKKTKTKYNRVPKYKQGWKKALYDKLKLFNRDKDNKSKKPSITVDEIIKAFGKNPKCYLTGKTINLEEPNTYNLDHKMPHSRGGTNTIDNMGICLSTVNRSKNDMTPIEFLEMCKDVVQHLEN